MLTLSLRQQLMVLLMLVCFPCFGADQSTIPVKAAAIKVAPVTNRVSTFGALSPKTENLSFRIPGRIARFNVEEGDKVHAGQLLAQLEEQDAQDDLDKQQVLLDQAKRSYSRMEQLHSKGSIQKSQLEDAADKLEQVTISFEKAELNLERCSLLAPSAGLILKEYQESRTTIGAGAPIFSFQSHDEKWVTKVELTDRNAFALSEGASAIVRFAPYPGVDFPGQLTKMARVANTNDGLYTAELTITNGGHTLRPGMVAEVDLYQDSVEKLAQFPLDALIQVRGYNGTVFLLKANSKTVSKIPITIHSVVGNIVAVKETLTGYTHVVTRGQANLEDGDTVSIVE